MPDAVLAFREVLLLGQRLRWLFDDHLPDGMTTAQAMLLTAADRLGGAPSFSEVAAAIATSPQNVARLARSLQEREFVEVRTDPDDGRVRRIHVTARSRAYWAARDQADFTAVGRLFEVLDPAELQTLCDLLGRVQEHVGAVYAERRG